MADLFGDDEDEGEGPSAPTEEDRAFIDDTGVRPDDRINFGDDEEQQVRECFGISYGYAH